MLLRVLLLAVVLVTAPGCLVLSLHPAYDDESLGWVPELLGDWQNHDDNASLLISRGEWRSYKLRYVHPIETGELTGYLTAIGDERYLDVMPARGEDRGAFMLPLHGVIRVRLEGDRLELTPLSFDWFFERAKQRAGVAGLRTAVDQKENVLLTSPSAALRTWLRAQPPGGPMFGAPATFIRKQG